MGPFERRSAALPLLLATCFGVTGCRVECMADEKASPKQIEREQKAMFRGRGICWELLTPKLAVVDDRVVLSHSKDNVIAQRAEVSTSAVKIFQPLHERLTGYRTHWKLVRAEQFDPTLYVAFDPALEPVRATSLLSTAAYAGFPRSRISAGGVELAAEWWIPPAEDQPERPILCVEPRDKGFSLRFQPVGAEASSASVDTLGADVTTACAGRAPCVDAVGIGERDGATFGELARLASSALGAAAFKARKPRLFFVTKAPIEVSPAAGPRLSRRACAR